MVKIITVFLAVGVWGFRAKKRRHHAPDLAQEEVVGVQRAVVGRVDGLYVFGAPATAVPGFKNFASPDGCFPGIRGWTYSKEGLAPFIDLVVPIATVVGYFHPWMEQVELDTTSSAARYFPCNLDRTNDPQGPAKMSLHDGKLYTRTVGRIDDRYTNMTKIATELSLVANSTVVADAVRAMGWRWVASGRDAGNAWIGGPQVSHLVQRPDSLECMVTFQGSSSFQDWVADFTIKKVRFCGRPELVHTGFRDHLRRIVKSEGFQNDMLPKLGRCSKVWIVGHSLGAAMSEMFTACNTFAPAVGSQGYEEDYKFMKWNKGTPSKLPYPLG